MLEIPISVFCIINTFLQIVFAVCWNFLRSDNLTNKATCLVGGLLWYHNNTLLFFCKECRPLSNTSFETSDSKIILSRQNVLLLQTLLQTEHTPPMAPLQQDYVYCLRNIWIWPSYIVCGGHRDVSNVAFIKKSGVQTQSQLAGLIYRCAVRSSAVGTVSLTIRPTAYICASKTAIPWLQSVTWLKCSPLSFVQLSCHLSLFTVCGWEHGVHKSHTGAIHAVLGISPIPVKILYCICPRLDVDLSFLRP